MSKEIQDYAFKNLSVVADCNQEYGNLVALLSSVLEDFKALYEISGKSYKWHNLLQNTLTTLNLNDETIERFRHELMSFTKFEVKKLIVAPSLKLQADRIKYLYAVRALIILWHLNNSKKIPSSLLDQLDTIFKAKKSEDEIIVQNLCIDVHQLVKFQESFTPTHKWFKFLSAVIIALQSLENEPSSNTLIPVEISTARQQEIEKSNAKSLDKVQEQDMSKEDRP